jgi:hypothetical protein
MATYHRRPLLSALATLSLTLGTAIVTSAVFTLWTGQEMRPRRVAVALVLAWLLMMPWAFTAAVSREWRR